MCAMSPCKSSVILLACVVGAGVTACGSSSGAAAGSASATSSAPASSAPASSSSAPAATGGSAASQSIAANWTAFFSAKTPVAKRVSLLQDGQQFSSIIKSQAGSGLASEATAKVTSVSVSSSSKAAVTYSILVAGQAALSGQKGVAVKEDGTWKVGLASFCGLLALENGGKTSGLPSACNSAG
jgi:hypothetical protein